MIQHILSYFEQVVHFVDHKEIKFQLISSYRPGIKCLLLTEIQASGFIQGSHVLQEHHLHAKSYQNVEL